MVKVLKKQQGRAPWGWSSTYDAPWSLRVGTGQRAPGQCAEVKKTSDLAVGTFLDPSQSAVTFQYRL